MKAYDTLWGYCAADQWLAESPRLHRTSCDSLFSQWLYGLCRALVSAKSARMGERAVLTNRPSLGLSPIVLKGLESLSGSVGQIRCLPQPEQLHGLRARTEQGRAWMMAQNERVVVGIDVAKDKVDACIRALSHRQTFPSG